jgi:fibronectin type 3 domain-containing protein
VTGTAPGASTHRVDLSWAASTSADVTGYNVYRAVYSNACEPLSKINTALVATTSYTDSTVADGASYCYATTAVDSSNESGYSNIVTDVQIPAS